MARRVRSSDLETRAAREKLKKRGKPYYKAIGPGLHVGYRKNKEGGRWVVRLYLGVGAYEVETLAAADDRLDADGVSVIDFWRAQELAQAKFRKLKDEGQAPAGSYRVRDAMEEYLAWLDDNRKSARDARYRAEALILPELGAVEIAKLTPERIRAWLKKVAETPARVRSKEGTVQRFKEADDGEETTRQRRATANRLLTVLKAALNRAFVEGKVPSDKAWRRVAPFSGVDRARVRYLTVEEARRLTNASEPSFRQLVQAALQTGCRYGELTALRVEDFNPDVGTVHVRQSKSGKGRHVVLTDEGVAFFAQATAGRAGGEILFQKASGAPWGASHQSRPMADAVSRARITPAIDFHGLRHTWASLAVMNGVPLMVVARNLGHADTRMVEKHYGHLAPSFIADAIRGGAPRFGLPLPTNIARLA